MNREGANGRMCHAHACKRCGRTALVKVHGESDFGAHRLPLLVRWRLGEESAMSSRSGSETFGKSAASIDQGTSPLFEVVEILGDLEAQRKVRRLKWTSCQPEWLYSIGNIQKVKPTSAMKAPLRTSP
jgi:hypothetical protein